MAFRKYWTVKSKDNIHISWFEYVIIACWSCYESFCTKPDLYLSSHFLGWNVTKPLVQSMFSRVKTKFQTISHFFILSVFDWGSQKNIESITQQVISMFMGSSLLRPHVTPCRPIPVYALCAGAVRNSATTTQTCSTVAQLSTITIPNCAQLSWGNWGFKWQLEQCN